MSFLTTSANRDDCENLGEVLKILPPTPISFPFGKFRVKMTDCYNYRVQTNQDNAVTVSCVEVNLRIC
jgi:hypothetical protein